MSGSLWKGLRWTFLAAVLVGALWSWRSSGQEVAHALERVDPWRVVAAQALVVCGLALTSLVWRTSLDAFVEGKPAAVLVAPFFVAQLGKYIPGGVWSFAAQGALGSRQGGSPRVPVAAAVLFLGVHVASGLVLTGVVGWWSTVPAWVVALALPLGLLGMTPAIHRRLGGRLSGRECHWGWGRSVRGGLVMVMVWCFYTAALVVLAPEPDMSLSLTLGSAFAVAFAVGVAVPIAPAGLGARDGVLLLLVTPILGAGPAAVVAVLARLVHTVADFLLAGVCWLIMRTLGTAGAAADGQTRD